MQKERECYRLKYQYELLESLIGKNRNTIRKAMYRKDIKNTTEGFVEYIKLMIDKGQIK